MFVWHRVTVHNPVSSYLLNTVTHPVKMSLHTYIRLITKTVAFLSTDLIHYYVINPNFRLCLGTSSKTSQCHNLYRICKIIKTYFLIQHTSCFCFILYRLNILIISNTYQYFRSSKFFTQIVLSKNNFNGILIYVKKFTMLYKYF